MPSSPMLNEKYFQADTREGWAAPTIPGPPEHAPAGAPAGPAAGDVMTVRGTVSATAVLFAILAVGAFFGWTSVEQTTGFSLDSATGDLVEVSTTSLPGWFFITLIAAFGVAILTAFKADLARFTAPIYAVLEGLVLGAISAVYEFQFDGIVLQAVLATFGVFLSMLALYGLRIIKVTERSRRMVMAAMMGIVVMYALGFVFSMFGSDIRFWNEPTPLGIGITLVIVAVAAYSLALDFDFIERAAAAGVPRRMEWFAAFGLVVGLVWLYLEILRLLSLLRGD